MIWYLPFLSAWAKTPIPSSSHQLLNSLSKEQGSSLTLIVTTLGLLVWLGVVNALEVDSTSKAGATTGTVEVEWLFEEDSEDLMFSDKEELEVVELWGGGGGEKEENRAWSDGREKSDRPRDKHW